MTQGGNTPGLEFSMGEMGVDVTILGTMCTEDWDRTGLCGFGDW